MDSNRETQLARGAYNWLRASPLLTIPTALIIYQVSQSVICRVSDRCDIGGLPIGIFVGVLVSALWHLILLQYANNPESEFVRRHGKQALSFAAVRTAIPLGALFLDSAVYTNGALAGCLAVPILVALWFFNSDAGYKQIKKEKGESAPSGPPMEGQKATEKTSDEKTDETLGGILYGLQSYDTATRQSALQKLMHLNYGSQAVLHQLEKMAVGDTEGRLRKSALDLLSAPIYRQIQGSMASTGRSFRQAILDEIKIWEADGLLPAEIAEVLRRRYDFTATPIPIPQPEPPVPAPAVSLPQEQPPAAATAPVPPPPPSKPQPTLTERLLSQTSINIFLYLGAFLVIGAALILAALVAATRLPILLGVTLLFAGGAVAIKKRLPQPSFTLFIVFSTLLPIDASVVAQSFQFSAQASSAYWAAVFFSMALIWGLATWYYASRLFSIAAFAAASLAFLNFGGTFDAPVEWKIFTIAICNLGGLLGVRLLKSWKDDKFAFPLFLATHILQALILLVSFVSVILNLIPGTAATSIWIAGALTWLASASFYAWSGQLYSFILLPWAAGVSLLPVSWLALRAFNASIPVQIFGLWAWGTLFAVTSEFAARRKAAYPQSFNRPALAGSVPLFIIAGIWGLSEATSYGFVCLMGTGIVYTVLMLLRPRAYVWTAALLAGLAGYFTFFHLPFIENTNFPGVYQWLGAALLLLVPELIFKRPFTSGQSWRWPPFVIGSFIAFVNLYLALINLDRFGASAIVFSSYAVLFAAFALHFRRSMLGYLATASSAIAVEFALQHFELDLWLPVFTGLSVLYFLAGYLFRVEKTRGWGSMLRVSGLALGAILSFAALFALKESGGWYVLAVAAIFIAETYLRREDRMEFAGPVFLSIAALLVLRDLTVHDFPYHLLSISLLWLTSDMLFQRTFKLRRFSGLTRGVGAVLAAINGILLFIPGMAGAMQAAICYGVYSVFFIGYAWFYRRPALGYIPTATIALGVFNTLRYLDLDLWLPVFTGLATFYFTLGFFLRLRQAGVWGEMLRTSGLILGALFSLAALFTLKATGGWYVLVIGVMAFAEIYLRPETRMEAGGPALFSLAAFLILRDFHIKQFPYPILAISLIWLGADILYSRTLGARRTATLTRFVGAGAVALNSLALPWFARPEEAAVCYGVSAVFLALYAWLYQKPLLGYAATVSLPLSLYFALRAFHQQNWLYEIIAVAALYYTAGYLLRRRESARGWSGMLLLSGLGLGTLNSISAPLQAGLAAALPVAVAATLFAVEAFARGNVWLGFPANLLYLEAYFLILTWLKVGEPQYFSMGAALLGMLMHYLLTRAGSRTGAFLTGMASQLVLLGTTYIQLYSTERLAFFVVIFFQALAVLIYGIVVRSRSLVIAPIIFIVLSVFTVIYGALKGISTVILIGCTGIVLLLLGILAVVLRERITRIGERLSDWSA